MTQHRGAVETAGMRFLGVAANASWKHISSHGMFESEWVRIYKYGILSRRLVVRAALRLNSTQFDSTQLKKQGRVSTLLHQSCIPFRMVAGKVNETLSKTMAYKVL